jgi:hypothetical protein
LYLLWTILFPILAAPWAEEPPQSAPVEASLGIEGFFIGLHGVGHVPYGTWTDHLYAGKTIGGITHPDDLSQVGPGGGGVLELGARTGIHDFTLQFDFNALTSREWENYARAGGNSLSANLYKWDLNFIWGVQLFRISSFFVQARVGVGYTTVTGSEEYHDFKVSYDYDFYQHSFSARAGLGAGLDLTRGLVIFLAVDHVVGVPGVDYPPEGSDKPYLGFTFSLGVRFWPAVIGE